MTYWILLGISPFLGWLAARYAVRASMRFCISLCDPDAPEDTDFLRDVVNAYKTVNENFYKCNFLRLSWRNLNLLDPVSLLGACELFLGLSFPLVALCMKNGPFMPVFVALCFFALWNMTVAAIGDWLTMQIPDTASAFIFVSLLVPFFPGLDVFPFSLALCAAMIFLGFMGMGWGDVKLLCGLSIACGPLFVVICLCGALAFRLVANRFESGSFLVRKTRIPLVPCMLVPFLTAMLTLQIMP